MKKRQGGAFNSILVILPSQLCLTKVKLMRPSDELTVKWT